MEIQLRRPVLRDAVLGEEAIDLGLVPLRLQRQQNAAWQSHQTIAGLRSENRQRVLIVPWLPPDNAVPHSLHNYDVVHGIGGGLLNNELVLQHDPGRVASPSSQV